MKDKEPFWRIASIFSGLVCLTIGVGIFKENLALSAIFTLLGAFNVSTGVYLTVYQCGEEIVKELKKDVNE